MALLVKRPSGSRTSFTRGTCASKTFRTGLGWSFGSFGPFLLSSLWGDHSTGSPGASCNKWLSPYTPRHGTLKPQRAKDREKILTTVRGKKTLTSKGANIKSTDFSTVRMKSRRRDVRICNLLTEHTCQPWVIYPTKNPLGMKAKKKRRHFQINWNGEVSAIEDPL